MMMWSQDDYDVRFDWGPVGADHISDPDGIVVVVDVLSFTTAVSVAVDRGTAVFPVPWHDSRAEQLAASHGAALAVGRREVTDQHPWSLSPAAIRTAPPTPRLVLPSPNGSTIAFGAKAPVVVAGCLRNATAVGRWVGERAARTGRSVAVVAAGERWPDGSLRPAIEDMLGAGAVVAAIAATHGRTLTFSPEVEAAWVMYESTLDIASAVKASGSGLELAQMGFASDAEVATELDTSSCVPVLLDGAFRNPA